MENTIIENTENQNETPKQNKILVKGLTKSQRDKLLSNGIAGIVGIIGGVGVARAFTPAEMELNTNSEEAINIEDLTFEEPTCLLEAEDLNDPVVEETIAIYTKAPFSNSVDDSMSFSDAFKVARKDLGAGGFFEWKGDTYNTYYKTEWDAMSKEQQNDFFASVDENSTEISLDNQSDFATVDVIESDAVEIVEVSANDDAQVITFKIEEEDFIEVDLNEDGITDIAAVNANANELPDFVLDLDSDGDYDRLVLDIDPETGITGRELVINLEENSEANDTSEDWKDDIETEEPDDDLTDDLFNDLGDGLAG